MLVCFGVFIIVAVQAVSKGVGDVTDFRFGRKRIPAHGKELRT